MFGAGGLWSSEDARHSFDERGFIGPMALLSAAECRRIVRYLRRKGDVPGAEWRKGRAVTERFIYEIAAHPRIVKALRELRGEDIILWGASIMDRAPGETQPWHTDIESASPAGGFVTVWIGLENTSAESGLRIVSRSHRLRKPVQEARHERGIARDLATDEEMLAIVREREPHAAILMPVVKNGQALLFDGLLWHMGSNTRKSGRRLALILQYAKASRPVRIPDLEQLDWPFRFHDEPRPPVIVISGKGDEAVNRIVAPPPSAAAPRIGSVIHHFEWPGHDSAERFRALPAFGGPTRTLEGLHCHASILASGHSPHPPHVHPEEELLVPIDGEGICSSPGTRAIALRASSASGQAPLRTIRPGSITRSAIPAPSRCAI